MTTTSALPAIRRDNRAARAFLAHLRNELRLLVREPATLIFGAVLPLAAILVMAAIPATRKPVAEMGGLSVLGAYLPTITLFATAVLGLTVIPAILGSYREMGVLRRLRTTPSSPATQLAALFTIITFASVVIAALIAVIPALFGAGLPDHLGWFALAVLSSITAFAALGTVLASVIPNAKAAPGVGNVVAVLMWAAAGMWYPRALFPEWLRTVADLTPGGAAAQAMLDAQAGAAASWEAFVVLIVWTLGAGILAVATFRWE